MKPPMKQSVCFYLSMISFILLISNIRTFPASSVPEYYYPEPHIFTNGIVRVVAFHEGRLYVGGNFTRVTDSSGTYERVDLAVYDMASGRVTDFIANTDRGTVRAIAFGNGALFVGGSFSKVNGIPCSRVAAIDPNSGSVINEFRNGGGYIDGEVWALAAGKSLLYVGGSFSSIDGYERSYLAALDINSGKVDERFNPSPSEPFDDSGRTAPGVWALKIHPENPEIVFVGGNFQVICGSEETPFLSALYSDGRLGPDFADKLVRSPVLALDACGPLLCAAGGGYVNRVVAYHIKNEPYERVWRSIRCQGDIQAVACAPQGYVFFGCHDGLFDSTDNFRMGVLNANTGRILEAYPEMNSFFGVRALAFENGYLAVGGDFTRMNGIPQKHLALFKKFSFDPLVILPPSPPALLSPQDNEKQISNTPVLLWRHSARALTYEIQLAADSSFSVLKSHETNITGTSFQCPTLSDATIYWWRVRAYNEAGAGEWSEICSYITAPGPEDIPVPVSPVDGSNAIPVAVNFVWHPTNSALWYNFRISETSDSVSFIFEKKMISDTSFFVSGLQHNKTYIWYISAHTPGGTSGWASAVFRTIADMPEVPRCNYPFENARMIDIQPVLEWKSSCNAESYIVQIASDSLFYSIFCEADNLTDTSTIACMLDEDTRYFWRVGAKNEAGCIWSIPVGFNTTFPLPSAPVLLTPQSKEIVKSDSVNLIWLNSNPHVIDYHLQIGKDSTFQEIIIDTLLTDTTYVAHNLCNRKRFWWRISAENERGWGPRGETRNFFVSFTPSDGYRFSLDKILISRTNFSVAYSVAG